MHGNDEYSTRNAALYIAKYNRFVDNILDRINKVLKKSYDPVSVRLQPVDVKKKSTKGKKKKTSTKKTIKENRIAGRRALESNATISFENDDAKIEKSTTSAASQNDVALQPEVSQTSSAPTSQISPSTQVVSETTARSSAKKQESTSTSSKDSPIVVLLASPAAPGFSSQKVATTAAPNVATVAPATNQNRAAASTEKVEKKKTKKNKKNKKGKGKGKQNKSKPRARGTLYGLATLRRSKDVTVNIMTDHTTVKTNFFVGPLVLKVEKEFGRGAKKEVKSATATTAEMYGKMNLRIPNGKAAKLHSIKVLQPKQVRVDSVDNHDRTREFIWRKSSDIAKVVSQKLKEVTRSMLKK